MLSEELTEDNPLLAVMWARFQEGCRLLFASGAIASTSCLLSLGGQACRLAVSSETLLFQWSACMQQSCSNCLAEVITDLYASLKSLPSRRQVGMLANSRIFALRPLCTLS